MGSLGFCSLISSSLLHQRRIDRVQRVESPCGVGRRIVSAAVSGRRGIGRPGTIAGPECSALLRHRLNVLKEELTRDRPTSCRSFWVPPTISVVLAFVQVQLIFINAALIRLGDQGDDQRASTHDVRRDWLVFGSVSTAHATRNLMLGKEH